MDYGNNLVIEQQLLREHFKKSSINGEESRVLMELLTLLEGESNRVIYKEGRPITLKQLSELVDMEEDDVVFVLDSLEDKGYIRILVVGGLVEIFCNPYLFATSSFTYSQVAWYFNDYDKK